MIYSNRNDKFQVIDYSPTHNQLLIRSLKSKSRKYNIDIIFKGVGCMVMPTLLSGLDISLVTEEKTLHELETKYLFNTDYDNRIFSIKSADQQEYFLNALCFGIYHNSLEILSSSIGRYDMGNLGELQKWYSD